MTQQVRTTYRKHPRTILAVTLGAIVALLVIAVLPAGAARVTGQVVNLGGQNFDCSNSLVKSRATNEFRVVNPVSGTTYTDPATQAKFKVFVTTSKKGQQLTWKSVSTASESVPSVVGVYDVIVKGGTNSMWYDYDADGAGGTPTGSTTVTEDLTPLTAPPKGDGTFYAISHTSFCYQLASISGTVFNDVDGSTTRSASNPTELYQPGWTVTLYGPTGTKTALTDQNGYYSFENLPPNVTYTVCETAPSGTWAQSIPSTTLSDCTSPQEPKGYSVNLTAAQETGKHFGNRTAAVLGCGGSTSTTGFDVQISGACGKTGQSEYVFEKWTADNKVFFNLVPTSTSSGGGRINIVQLLTGSINQPADPGATPQGKVRYDDGISGVPEREMPYCEWDPRTDPMLLPTGFSDSASVLPGNHTSCILEGSQTVDTTNDGDPDTVYLTYFIYTSVDGKISFG